MGKASHTKKGAFGDGRLPVARKYIVPPSRGGMLLLGAALAALAGILLAADVAWRDARLLSNGPLSSAHAVLENDCAACHDAWSSVSAEKCSVCHEKHGDRLGVYTWTAHYLYRSNDFQRHGASEHETGCAACHLEHRGREVAMTRIDDAPCEVCHGFDSFTGGHPQFDAVEAGLDEAGGLEFPHIVHVRELMGREGLVDVEKSCLYCHQPRSDGKAFQPIDFDAHCDACHLTTVQRTPPITVRGDGPGGQPGVLSLEAIRERRDPGTRWADFMSPAEFRERGGEISKSPVYHRDPWVLENLRLLRRELYDDPGLADLLRASPEVSPRELPALYTEAIATLESWSLGLRSRPEPEIQAELEAIDALLDELRRAVENPLTPLDETRFLLALERRPELDEATATTLERLVFEVTAVCQQCHRVEDATLVRVRQELGVLDRARFDHRAHILQVRCLDCHAEIPIAEHLDLSTDVHVEHELDRAAIVNLPGIETCRECHTSSLVSQSCQTCHDFHPNKSRRSEMLLYLDVPAAEAP